MAAQGSKAHARPPGEIIGIQAMRYIAALAVLVDHYVIRLCEQGTLPNSVLPLAYRLGGMGVFVFFAISGFVMVLTNRDKFGQPSNGPDFFARRLIRIWPMYFVATIIVFGARYGADPLYTFGNLLKSLLFIPYIGVEDLYRPILGKGWTLNYEMFFYAVFALCLCVPKKIGLTLAALVLVFLGANHGSEGGVLWKFYADKIVLFFMIGMVLGYLVNETRVRWPHFRSAGAAVIAGVAAFTLALFAGRLPLPPAGQEAVMFIAITVSLYAVCFKDSRFRNGGVARTVALLGDSSYSLYLFHGFIMVALNAVLNKIGSFPPAVLMLAVCVAATIGCALIHLYLEKPVNRILLDAYKKASKRRAVPVTPQPGEAPAEPVLAERDGRPG